MKGICGSSWNCDWDISLQPVTFSRSLQVTAATYDRLLDHKTAIRIILVSKYKTDVVLRLVICSNSIVAKIMN